MRKLVDTREPWSLRAILLKTGWEQQALPFGDYQFQAWGGELVALERKKGADILDMPRTRRELQALVEGATFPILLREGSLERNGATDLIMEGNGQVTWQALWDMLESFQDLGLRIQDTTSEAHTIQRLNELYAYYQKPTHLSPVREKRLGGNRPAQSLLAVPMISEVLAQELIKHFGTLANLAQADEVSLLAVPGVGEKRSMTIWHHFHEGGKT